MRPLLLELALELVKESPGFEKQKQVIAETTYTQKFPFEPFSDFSWVTGRRNVRLANSFDSWTNFDLPRPVDGFPQANNLIHEAVHGLQIDQACGFGSWFATYSQRAGRYRLELEAYSVQIRHVMACFQVSNNEQIMDFIDGIAERASRHYLLFGYKNKYDILEDLVRETKT